MSESVFDPAYEFNAPRFYDFNQVENSSEGDSFFEKEDALFQPSPEKPAKGKKRSDVAPKEQAPPIKPNGSKGNILTKAMRALRLTNGDGENKVVFKKPEVPKQKLMHSGLRPVRQPSPTIGVKKCKPQSPTKPKAFALHTDERGRLPRKRELFSSSSNSRSGQTSAYGSSGSINTAIKPLNGTNATVTSSKTLAKSASQENVQGGGARARNTSCPTTFLNRRSASAGQLAEKQAPNFKARPAPPAVISGLPSKHAKPATLPQPFTFQTDKIIAQHKEKPCQKKDEERRRKTEFHARPMPDFSKTAFCARAGEKHITASEPLLLHTERRAEKRKAFDEIVKKREEDIKEEHAQRDNEKRRLEEEEIRKLRRTLVHQPLPIKMNKPMEVKRGVIATTKPETPKFLIEQRLKQRALNRPQNENGK